MPSRVLYLYRPTLPGVRAQAIQVVHAAHALAARGHHVTLLADRARHADPSTALAAFGLEPLPTLNLEIAPSAHPGMAGLWFRARAMAWSLGAPGLVLARDRQRLTRLLPLLRRHRVVLEVHGLDSARTAEDGGDPRPHLEIERAALSAATALIANCEGTLQAWEQAHGALLPPRRAAIHNGTNPSRRRGPGPTDPVIRVVGSLRAYKGLDELVRDAAALPLPLELIGGSAREIAELRAPDSVRVSPPVPFLAVPDLLARSAALLLPLADNLFGRELTSPLKLWDYLACAAPIIAPALSSVSRVAALSGAPLHLYTPGDAASLARAAAEALAAPLREPFVRSWAARAAEVEELFA